MRLRDLQSFVVVAQEESFTRAANRLHIAQPPLTYRIQQLEERLGVRLFDRTTRRVTLTPAGRVYLDHLKPALATIALAAHESRRAERGELGTLRLGYTGRASQEYLPRLLSRFRVQNPDVTLDLSGPSPTGDLESGLLEGRLDAALCFLPLRSTLIHTQLLFESEFSIAMSDVHPLARNKQLSLTDLSDESFVAYPYGAGFHLREATDQICLDAGFVPHVVRETEASQTLLCLVAAGIGVSIIPRDLKSLSIEGVTYFQLPSDTMRLQHGLAWLGANRNPVLARLLSLVNEPCDIG